MLGSCVKSAQHEGRAIFSDRFDRHRISRGPLRSLLSQCRGGECLVGSMQQIPMVLQLTNDIRVCGDPGRSGDFLGDKQVELAGGFRGQGLEAFSADDLDFFGALQEGHAEAE